DRNPDSEVIVPEWVKHPGQSDQQDPEAQAPDGQEPADQEQADQEPASREPGIETPPTQDEVADPQTPAAPVIPTTSTRSPHRPVGASKTSDLPIWSTSAGRLTLSLNYISSLVASMGVLLLIIAAFVLGRMTTPEPTALRPPTEPPVLERQVGKYYMVIEMLADESNASRFEADRIVKFCSANDEPSEVQLLPKVVNGKIVKGKGNLIVWSLTPFDSKKCEEVDAHARHIQNELGVKYAKAHGSKYKFMQTRNGELDPLMFQHEESP
ncbi:MAG: hypothetical protein QGH60_24500, partial [Phycisphaerae bacterium]|nr:hypothetical protein [Phycisphaerae bacterium]